MGLCPEGALSGGGYVPRDFARGGYVLDSIDSFSIVTQDNRCQIINLLLGSLVYKDRIQFVWVTNVFHVDHNERVQFLLTLNRNFGANFGIA